MITQENIIQHEFIGLNTTIEASSNPQIIGLNGTITNETKSMFTINTSKGIKQIPKDHSTWVFDVNNDHLKIDGSKIQKRPFDRLGAKA